MNQFIIDGYVKSRIFETTHSAGHAVDEWTPPTRGPAFLDRVGRTLVAVGASMVRDPAALDRIAAEAHARAA